MIRKGLLPSNKRKEKKNKKRNSLYDAAYELFITKGINNTAIDDIVKKAGVAKGTFYLYFKDKYDIIDKIIFKKSNLILSNAIEAVERKEKEEGFHDFVDCIIFFIDYMIEYFKNNKMLLRVIYKNLSWGMYRKALLNENENDEVKKIVDIFVQNTKNNKYDIYDVEKTLFIILELTGSICYSAIILKEPDTIDNMKPILFRSIKKILLNSV